MADVLTKAGSGKPADQMPRRWRRTRRAAGACVVVLCALWGTPAYAATEPYPDNGGAASAWKCTDTATADTPPVTGQTCVVTAWEADPPAPDGAGVTSSVALTDSQYETLAFGLGLVLLMGSAHMVAGWRR